MRKRHVLLLIFLVGLTVYFELAKDVTYGSTYATKRQGARAFFLSLRELGKDATPWLEPFESLKSTTENATMFVVSVPDFKGIDSLEEWVRKGNRLVLINSFPGAGFTKGVLNEQSTKDALLTLMDVEGKSTPVDCESILSQECDGVKYLSETGVSLGLVDEDIEILVGTAKNAKVAYQKVGKGDVFLISSESIILNQNIEKFDNFRFLYQIATAHKKIFFDEFHHGYRSPVAARMESRKNAVWVLIGTLVGVLLLGALSRAVRFGPPTEVPEIPLSSTVEFAGVLGMLYREHKAQEVLGCYIRSWRRRLSRRFGIALGLSHENALMQLVDKGMISSAQAKEATRYIFELENGAVSDSASEERVSYIERILETELAASM